MRLLDAESAPNYVIRLWSHCQTRKTNKFPEWNPAILASVCRWSGDADQFWSAMMQTFCRCEDGHVVAHQWDEVNASLIAAWSNGGKGGRPKKPTGNPRVNPESNPVNPQITHGVTDREDREENREKTQAPKSPRQRFVKPSLEDVQAQCKEIGLSVSEAIKFILYYESKGWIVGKTLMKCWKSALIRWKLRRDESLNLSMSEPTVKKEINLKDSL